LETLKIKNKPYQQLRFADALHLLTADFAAGNGNEMLQVFQQAFHSRDQRQLGYYVLLAAAGINLDAEHTDVMSEHEENPVARYLALHSSPVLRKHASQWAVGSKQWAAAPFLEHLAVTHALYQRWQNDKIVKGTPARRAAEQERALAYVRQNKGTVWGWGLLCLMQDREGDDKTGEDKSLERPLPGPSKTRRRNPAASDPRRGITYATAAGSSQAKRTAPLADAWTLFAEVPGLAYSARYEQARSLWRAGLKPEARKLFVALYEKRFQLDLLPAIDADFRSALLGDGTDANQWSALVRKTAGQMIAKKRRPAVLALAWQCWQLEDRPLADHLLSTALEGTPEKERVALTLAGIRFYQNTGQLARADGLLQKLEADPKLAGSAGLWRLGAGLAEGRDMQARALFCLEKALEAEYQQMPEVIDLKHVRADYRKLLEHYQGLAGAMVALEVKPKPEFLAKVVRAADRWRALDREDTSACQLAGHILRTLGDRDLSWDYLTTPVGLRPNESEPWVDLAKSLSRQGDLDLADRAFAAAFSAEPTNAQILWDRAESLRQAGKTLAARKLFRQIAEGQWQPRFQGLKAEARLQTR
jgi:tetratricopeptide (TPR) repeat protein